MYTAMSQQSGAGGETGNTGVGVGSCCLSGKIHDGTPAGSDTEIGGLPCYVSPSSDGTKEKTIIAITDIFGYKLPNIRLLADTYAKEGFQVIVPDFHQGDSLPHEFLQDVEPPLPKREEMGIAGKAAQTVKVQTTLGPWLIKHREGVSKPLIDDFIATIRSSAGVEKIGVIGFCWGARYAILAGHETDPSKSVDAVYGCHPALVSVPGDFDPVVKPTSLAVGEKDSLLGQSEVDQIKEIFSKKSDVPTEVQVYEDQIHGFTVRGDWSSDKDKESMDKAVKQGVAWFKKYLA